jgi:hypothetical protein
MWAHLRVPKIRVTELRHHVTAAAKAAPMRRRSFRITDAPQSCWISSFAAAARSLQERGGPTNELAPRWETIRLPLRLAKEQRRGDHPGSLPKIVHNERPADRLQITEGGVASKQGRDGSARRPPFAGRRTAS